MASSYVSSLNSQSSIASIVNSLMIMERQPVLELQQTRGQLNTTKAIYADADTNLTALRSQAKTLTDALDSPFAARQAASSNSAAFTATATASASLGTHDIHVHQLARHHSLVSDRLASAATTLRDTLGVGDYSFNVTIAGVETAVNVSIGADDDNAAVLENVAAAINAALTDVEDGATASALDVDGSNVRLMLRSDGTGLAQKMTLTDVSGGLLAALGVDAAGASSETEGGYIYSDGQLTAQFSVDGVRLTRDENTISDALSGVTLTLTGVQESGAADATLSITTDTAAIRTAVDGLLSAYNDALAHLKAKTSVDRTTGERGPLAEKFTYRNLISRMRSLMAGAVSTVGEGHAAMLSEIGIKPDSDGKLSITDADAFADALAADPDAVGELFRSAEGVAAQLDAMLEPFVKTGGYLDSDRDAIDSRVTAINDRVSRLEARLVSREQILIRQYSQLMEVQQQYSSQTSLFNNIYAALYGSSY